jgi:hypothetical protein
VRRAGRKVGQGADVVAAGRARGQRAQRTGAEVSQPQAPAEGLARGGVRRPGLHRGVDHRGEPSGARLGDRDDRPVAPEPIGDDLGERQLHSGERDAVHQARPGGDFALVRERAQVQDGRSPVLAAQLGDAPRRDAPAEPVEPRSGQ